MSRSGYSDDCEGNGIFLYRGSVERAIKGKRGQAMLRELLSALDAMPVRRLIACELECDGEVCALGALGRARGLDMASLDPEEPDDVADAFGVAPSMAKEIVYENDESNYYPETPEERWQRMRRWVCENIRPEPDREGGP